MCRKQISQNHQLLIGSGPRPRPIPITADTLVDLENIKDEKEATLVLPVAVGAVGGAAVILVAVLVVCKMKRPSSKSSQIFPYPT